MTKSVIAMLLCVVTSGKFMHAQDTHRALLSLSDAIAFAVQNNPDVLVAQKKINAAAGRVLQAGHIPNTEFSVLYNLTPTNFSFGEAEGKDIELSQQIIVG